MRFSTVPSALDGTTRDDVGRIHLAKDLLVLPGGNDSSKRTMTAISLFGSKRLWSRSLKKDDWAKELPKGMSLASDFTFVGHSTVTGIAELYVNPCPDGASLCHVSQTDKTAGLGLLAIDGSTGRVRWRNDLLPPQARSKLDDRQALRVVGGNDEVIRVLVGPSSAVEGGVQTPTRTRVITTVALRTADGRELWRRQGWVAHLMSGDKVLGHSPITTNAVGVGIAAVLDARTGALINPKGLPKNVNGRWLPAPEGDAVVAGRDTQEPALILDLASGALLQRSGNAVDFVAGSAPGGKGVLACWGSTSERFTWLDRVAVTMDQAQGELGDLDAVAGDGDHGLAMARGSAAARAAAAGLAAEGAGALTTLAGTGQAWSDAAGGTSGALWGAMLTAVGRTLGDQEPVDGARLALAARAALDAVQELGQAQPGDKTLVDALAPAVDALEHELTAGAALPTAVEAAAAAAEQGARETVDQVARVGRARPLGERSRGTGDPGAVSLAMVVRVLGH